MWGGGGLAELSGHFALRRASFLTRVMVRVRGFLTAQGTLGGLESICGAWCGRGIGGMGTAKARVAIRKIEGHCVLKGLQK